MAKSVLVSLALIVTTGCTSLNSVSVTSIPPERKSPVKTEKSKLIILGFNFDNDFVDETVDDLKKQCPNGKVTGLLTKDEDVLYFSYFVWRKRITATGYCVKSTNVGLNGLKGPKMSSQDLVQKRNGSN